MPRPFHAGLFEAEGFIMRGRLRFVFEKQTLLPPFTSRLVKHALHTLPCMEPVLRAYRERGAYRRVTLTPLMGPGGPLYKRRGEASPLTARRGEVLEATITVYSPGLDTGLLNGLACTGRLPPPYDGVVVENAGVEIVRLRDALPGASKRLQVWIQTPLLLTQKLLAPPAPGIQGYLRRVPQAYRLLPTPGYLAAAGARLWLGVVHGEDPDQSPVPYSLARLADLHVAEEDYRLRPVTAVYSGGDKPRLARGTIGYLRLRMLGPRIAETMARLLGLAQWLGLGKSRSIGFGMIKVEPLD